MHKDTNYGVPGDDKETDEDDIDEDGTNNTFDTEASNKQMSIAQACSSTLFQTGNGPRLIKPEM